MLKYKLRKKNKRAISQRYRAIDILYEKMVTYNTTARDLAVAGKKILEKIYEDLSTGEMARGKEAVGIALGIEKLLQKMLRIDEMVVDCATKLAPYQTPKLESLEVKSKVTNRFVIESMQPLTWEKWSAATGATALKPDEVHKEIQKEVEIVPSIHDFENLEEQNPNGPNNNKRIH